MERKIFVFSFLSSGSANELEKLLNEEHYSVVRADHSGEGHSIVYVLERMKRAPLGSTEKIPTPR